MILQKSAGGTWQEEGKSYILQERLAGSAGDTQLFFKCGNGKKTRQVAFALRHT